MGMFMKYEDIFDLILPSTRRADNNPYCRSNRRSRSHKNSSNKELNLLITSAETVKDIMDIVNPGSPCVGQLKKDQPPSPARSVKFNLQNPYNLQTVEFRQHHATFDFVETSSWIKLLLLFVEVSVKTPYKEIKVFTNDRKVGSKYENFFKVFIEKHDKDNQLYNYYRET